MVLWRSLEFVNVLRAVLPWLVLWGTVLIWLLERRELWPTWTRRLTLLLRLLKALQAGVTILRTGQARASKRKIGEYQWIQAS